MLTSNSAPGVEHILCATGGHYPRGAASVPSTATSGAKLEATIQHRVTHSNLDPVALSEDLICYSQYRSADTSLCAQREFAQKHLPDDPMFKLVSKFYEVVPGVLTQTGKVQTACVALNVQMPSPQFSGSRWKAWC